MITAAPTIVAVESDSAWVVILAVSVVTLPLTLLARRLFDRPGGLASALLLGLPLVLPLVAAAVYQGGVLPEIAVLRPVGPRALSGHPLNHLLMLGDGRPGIGIPYVLSGAPGPYLFLIGMLVTGTMLLRRAAGYVALRRMVNRCEPLDPHHPLRARVRGFAAAAGLPRTPEVLLLPPDATGAFATGGREPRILVARELIDELDDDEIAAVAAHEIAHIRTRDIQVISVAGILRDLVAWNPVAHLAYRRLTGDREFEADRRAAALTGKPLAVASSLLKMCELVHRRSRHTRFALGFVRPRARIKRRVAHLLALADGRVSAMPLGAAPFVAAAALAAILGLQAASQVVSDRGAFAIVWGAPDHTTVWRGDDVAPKFNPARAKHRAPKVRQRPITAGSFPIGGDGFALREQDFPKFVKALTSWAKSRGLPTRPIVGRVSEGLRAVPLFLEPGLAPVGFYRIEALEQGF